MKYPVRDVFYLLDASTSFLENPKDAAKRQGFYEALEAVERFERSAGTDRFAARQAVVRVNRLGRSPGKTLNLPMRIAGLVLSMTLLAAMAIVLVISKLGPPENTPTVVNVNTVPCAPNAIEVSLIFALNPQQDYMSNAVNHFNDAYARGVDPIDGSPLTQDEPRICVLGTINGSSRTMEQIVNAVTIPGSDNVARPTMFAPSVSTWLSLTNAQSGQELFRTSDVHSIALTPVVIAIWESRLNAIRQTVLRQEIGWADLLGVLNAPNGWRDYGIEGGHRRVYYGHTDPRSSSTGLSAVIAEYYAAAHNAGYTDRRLTRDIVLDPAVLGGVRQIEQLIRHYAVRTDEYLNLIAQGPDYVDFVALEEADVLFLNGAFADQGFAPDIVPPEPLVALYPREGTVWHERPVGIVNADWVTPEQRAAAQVFVNYLRSPAVQTEIVSHGFRPVASPVNPGYPIVEGFGVNPRGPQTILDMPDTETIITIQQNWSLVKKPVDLMVLIDTSGSMNDDNKLEQAIMATPTLVAGMEGSDRVGLAVFGDTFQVIQPVAPIDLGQAGVLSGVENLQANGGTDLNTAVRDAVTIMNDLGDSNRIRAVVVLSDGVEPGQDGAGLEDAVQAITASQDDLNPVMVIPIAYGTDADESVFDDLALASRTNAFSSDPDNIGDMMQIIGSFWGS